MIWEKTLFFFFFFFFFLENVEFLLKEFQFVMPLKKWPSTAYIVCNAQIPMAF